MRRKEWKLNRELVKYFSAYLCVLVPILLVSIVLGTRSFRALKQETISSMQEGIEEVASGMNNLTDRLQRTAINLTNDTKYYYNHISQDREDTISAISNLSMVGQMDPGVDSLALVFPSKSIVYSSEGKEYLNVYVKNTSKLDAESQTSYRGIVEQDASVIMLLKDVMGRGKLLFYHAGGFNRLSNDVPKVCILYDFAKIEQQFSRVLGVCPAYIFFEFENSQHTAMYYDGAGAFEYVAYDSAVRSNDWEDYQEICKQQITSGISMKISCQTARLYHQFRTLQLIYVLSLIVGLMVSTILCYKLSERRYHYLMKLYQTTSNSFKPPVVNEYSVLNAVSSVVEQRENARKKNEAAQRLLAQQNAMLFFHGLIRNEEEIEKLLHESGIEAPDETLYSVVGILLSKGDYHLSPFLSAVGSKLSYEMKINNKQALFVLVPLKISGEPRFLRREIGQKLSSLLRQFGEERIVIAFSRLYSNVFQSGNAMTEVAATLEYLWCSPQKEQITFGEDILPTENNIKHLPEESLRTLQKLLREKNEKGALVRLHILCEQIESQERSLLLKRYMRYEIIYAITREIRSNEKDHEALLMDAVEINTDDALFEGQVQSIIIKFCRKADRKQFDFCDVLNYIDAHYMDSNLSQKQIADHFQMNRSYLSTLFKSKMSFGYMEYLTELRMKNALELLRSGVSVQEAAGRVGYADENTFRKRFRERFGYSPSEIDVEAQG